MPICPVKGWVLNILGLLGHMWSLNIVLGFGFVFTTLFKHKSEIGSGSVVSSSLQPHGLYSPWNSPGQNTGVGSLSFFQGILPTQALNPSLPHCRQILYQLSHKENSRILK